jgi:bifunctional DNA-binding transcriptional regulator/antitoxin component of YhaV-PrlF toxin-antitoxin module
VRFDVYGDVILVAAASSATSITAQGHLRLPLAVRRRCRISAGTRLLVVARPDSGTLVVCTMSAVHEMVLARLASTDQGSGGLS